MAIVQVFVNLEASKVPLGKPALVEVQEEFWTADWCNGLRSRTYLGTLCYHISGTGVCIQPAAVNQGMPDPPCIPFDPSTSKITVLSGRLSDYT